MQVAVERRNLPVAAVNSKSVLGEVVGPDAEERDFGAQLRDDEGHAGHFYHNADLNVAEPNAGCVQFGPCFREKRFGGAHFFDTGDHWEHQLNVAKQGGPEYRPQLRLQQIGKLGVEADGAVTEERILLTRKVEVRDRLVAAYVQRADDNRLVPGGAHDICVGAVLLFLIGRRFAVHEQHLGAKQADAFRAALERGNRFFRRCHIGGDLERFTVSGPAFRADEARKRFGATVVPIPFQRIISQHGRRGFRNHNSPARVHQQWQSGGENGGRIAHAGHAGNAKRAGEDNCVGGRAAVTHDNAPEQRSIQRKELRRR